MPNSLEKARTSKFITLRRRGETPSRYRLNAEDLASIPFPQIPSNVQQEIAAEVRRRLAEARGLRGEAEADWAAAKRPIEEQLLSQDS
jgi:hypothetical protein